MTQKKIFLVVIANNMESISYATSDQFKAQRMCHRIARASGIDHAVVTENWFDLPLKLRCELRNEFKVTF